MWARPASHCGAMIASGPAWCCLGCGALYSRLPASILWHFGPPRPWAGHVQPLRACETLPCPSCARTLSRPPCMPPRAHPCEQVFYGGHITDAMDRRCCTTYLSVLIREEILPSGDLAEPGTWGAPTLELAPGFRAPMPRDHDAMREYIEAALPAESPVVYGMHPNAELSLLTSQGETLFRTLVDVSGRSSGAQGGLNPVPWEGSTRVQALHVLLSGPHWTPAAVVSAPLGGWGRLRRPLYKATAGGRASATVSAGSLCNAGATMGWYPPPQQVPCAIRGRVLPCIRAVLLCE
jgi:hypothetical protein